MLYTKGEDVNESQKKENKKKREKPKARGMRVPKGARQKKQVFLRP